MYFQCLNDICFRGKIIYNLFTYLQEKIKKKHISSDISFITEKYTLITKQDHIIYHYKNGIGLDESLEELSQSRPFFRIMVLCLNWEAFG